MANFCCPTFHAYFARAGEAGLGVVVEGDDEPRFTLQHRAIDQADEPALEAALPVAVATGNGIHFCPWCGCRLSWRHQREWKEMVRPELGLKAEPEL